LRFVRFSSHIQETRSNVYRCQDKKYITARAVESSD
jgi:hypothetical protein